MLLNISFAWILSCMVIVLGHTTVAISGESGQQEGSNVLERVDFHYVIFENHLVEFEGARPPMRRNMSVLLDEDAFSEETLRRLFEVLSKGFAKDEILSIRVITNVKQTITPEITTSDAPTPPEYFNHHRATYMRTPTYVFFRYTPTPTSRELKSVILRDDRGRSKSGNRS